LLSGQEGRTVAGTSLLVEVHASIAEANSHKGGTTMEKFIETVFDNRFFQMPFLEALSYVAAVLLVGAIIVSLTRRALGIAWTPPVATTHEERPSYEEEWREWKKAA
jgi:hypothetical protein